MKKKSKGQTIIIIILIILLIILAICGYYIYKQLNNNNNENPINNLKNQTKKEPTKLTKVGEYDLITSMGSNYFIIEENEKYGVIDTNGKIIEEIKYDDISYLIDNYYYTTLKDQVTLKRKGNTVGDISKYEGNKLYKDENEKDAPYILLYSEKNKDTKKLEYSHFEKAKDDLRLTYASTKKNYKTIVYNSKTGEKVKEIDNYLRKKEINNTKEKSYFAYDYIKDETRTITYYDKDLNKTIKDNNYIPLDNIYNEDFSHNEQFLDLVTTKKQLGKKYGYYSIKQQKLILPIEYGTTKKTKSIVQTNKDETLFVIRDNTFKNYYATKGKYTLVDSTNKQVLKGKYDNIDLIENFILVAKGTNLKIYDKNLKELYSFKFIEYDKKYCSGKKDYCDLLGTYIFGYQKLSSNILAVESLKKDNDKTINKDTEENESTSYKYFYIKDDKIDLKEEEIHVLVRESLDKRYIIRTTYDNDSKLKKVTIYDENLEKINAIDTNIPDNNNNIFCQCENSCDANIPDDDHFKSHDHYDYDISEDGNYLLIKYCVPTQNDTELKTIYYDIKNNKEVQKNEMYNYNKEGNYYYQATYNDQGNITKMTIYNKNNNEIALIEEKGYTIRETNSSKNYVIISKVKEENNDTTTKDMLYKFE